MAIVDIRELQGVLDGRRRLLGLDVGAKTVGMAVSDENLTVASPLRTIRRTKFTRDVETLAETVRETGAGALVIGLPVSMDGSEGPRCQSVRQFARNVLGHIDMPAAFWDERLSTAAVERMLVAEADMSRQRRRQVVDKLAAAYILQGALDAIGAQARQAGARQEDQRP